VTLRWASSFDNFQDSDASGVFSSITNSSGTGLNFSTSYSRWPTGKGMRFNVAGSFGSTTVQTVNTFDAQSTWVVGAGVRPVTPPSGSFNQNAIIFALKSGSNYVCELRLSGSTYAVTRNGTTLATGGAISASAFAFVEFKVVIHPTAGSYTVRLNGSTYLTASGTNTSGTGGTTADSIESLWGAGNSSGGYSGECWFDDMYIADGNSVGTAPVNDFVGDCHPQHLLPNANGTFSDWAQTGGTGGSPYTAVNDTPNNGDTSYLSSGAINQRTTLRYPALTSGTVRAVIVAPWIRKDDANVHVVSPRTYEGGTEQTGSATTQPSTTYTSRQLVMETDPKDGAAWDLTRVNNSEIGLVLVS